jgi:predicted nucleotidyltransferase
MTEGEQACFQKTSIHHRLVHKATEVEVDLVPFGNISDSQQLIRWPDDNTMSVLGLEEAWVHAEVEEIAGVEVRLPPLPIIVALKLLAWDERREQKDLDDVVSILQNYQADDRIYDELYDELAAEEVKLEAGAVVLIGRDIQKFYQESPALERVRAIVETLLQEQETHLPRFVAADNDDWDNAFEQLAQQFQALRYGLGVTDD